MPKYPKDCWQTYLADHNAERLVKCIYRKAQEAACKKGDRKYVVARATEALVKLTRERGLKIPIPLTDIQQRATIKGTTGLWPWRRRHGRDAWPGVLQECVGPKAFFIKNEFWKAFDGLFPPEVLPVESESILRLQGLGKDVWAGIDAQDYVRHERSAWAG